MVEKIAENQDYNSQPLGINKIFNTTPEHIQII